MKIAPTSTVFYFMPGGERLERSSLDLDLFHRADKVVTLNADHTTEVMKDKYGDFDACDVTHGSRSSAPAPKRKKTAVR